MTTIEHSIQSRLLIESFKPLKRASSYSIEKRFNRLLLSVKSDLQNQALGVEATAKAALEKISEYRATALNHAPKYTKEIESISSEIKRKVYKHAFLTQVKRTTEASLIYSQEQPLLNSIAERDLLKYRAEWDKFHSDGTCKSGQFFKKHPTAPLKRHYNLGVHYDRYSERVFQQLKLIERLAHQSLSEPAAPIDAQTLKKLGTFKSIEKDLKHLYESIDSIRSFSESVNRIKANVSDWVALEKETRVGQANHFEILRSLKEINQGLQKLHEKSRYTQNEIKFFHDLNKKLNKVRHLIHSTDMNRYLDAVEETRKFLEQTKIKIEQAALERNHEQEARKWVNEQLALPPEEFNKRYKAVSFWQRLINSILRILTSCFRKDHKTRHLPA